MIFGHYEAKPRGFMMVVSYEAAPRRNILAMRIWGAFSKFLC